MKSSGYSGTPLVKKLGIKEGFRLKIINQPEHYWNLLSELPQELQVLPQAKKDLDIIHFFTTKQSELFNNLIRYKSQIKNHGMIWVSWPKKTSKVPTDITEDTIRNYALEIGLVDVKVCAIDVTWSGLKLVIPVSKREIK
jgi:hypothetical protein